MVSERPMVLFRGTKPMHTDRGPLGPVFSEQTQTGSLEYVKKKKSNIYEKTQCDALRSSQFHYVGCRTPLHDKRMRLNRKGKKGG